MTNVIFTWIDADGRIRDLSWPVPRVPVEGDEVVLDCETFWVRTVRFVIDTTAPANGRPSGIIVHIVKVPEVCLDESECIDVVVAPTDSECELLDLIEGQGTGFWLGRANN